MAFCIVCGARTETDAPLCDPSGNRCEEWLVMVPDGLDRLPRQHRERYKRGWDAALKASIARERREAQWREDFERLIEIGWRA